MSRSRTRLAADWFAKLRLDSGKLTTQDDIDTENTIATIQAEKDALAAQLASEAAARAQALADAEAARIAAVAQAEANAAAALATQIAAEQAARDQALADAEAARIAAVAQAEANAAAALAAEKAALETTINNLAAEKNALATTVSNLSTTLTTVEDNVNATISTQIASLTSDIAAVESSLSSISLTPDQVSGQHNTATSYFEVPQGTTAQRPSIPHVGMLRYNTSTGTNEIYDALGWTAIAAPPVLSSLSTYNVIEKDTTHSITIYGQGFAADQYTTFIGSDGIVVVPNTVTRISTGEIRCTFTGSNTLKTSGEPYTVRVANGNGLTGTMAGAINVDGKPIWQTATGSLGTIENYLRGSTSLSVYAVDEEGQDVSYSVVSGSLPTGMSINASTGALTGTPAGVGSDTTYSFTIRASDTVGNVSDRSFSVTIKKPTVVTFLSPTTTTWTVPQGVSSVEVLIVGGGGGGGNNRGNGPGGTGGGGGVYHNTNYSVASGAQLTVRVGGAGSGAGCNNQSGCAGSYSQFSSTTAGGGGGGVSEYNNNCNSGWSSSGYTVNGGSGGCTFGSNGANGGNAGTYTIAGNTYINCGVASTGPDYFGSGGYRSNSRGGYGAVVIAY